MTYLVAYVVMWAITFFWWLMADYTENEDECEFRAIASWFWPIVLIVYLLRKLWWLRLHIRSKNNGKI